MLIVDDHVARSLLGGSQIRDWRDEIPVLPWTLHVRLLRALLDSRSFGRLSRTAQSTTLEVALSPPSDVLQILDPRPFTTHIAQLKATHRISIAAAELLAAAIATGASLHVAEGNVGRSWGEILSGTNVSLYIYDRSGL